MSDEEENDALTELIEIEDRYFQNHSIVNQVYFVPVDEDEEERLERQSQVLLQVMGDKLYMAPISNPKRILECGYGQGHWAVQAAEEFSASKVVAIDIYPVLLPHQPENMDCDHWNLNDSLLRQYSPGHFDLVHSRCVGSGIKASRWSSYVRELSQLLKRGGWLQLGEFYANIQSDNGRLTENHALYRWGVLYRSVMKDRLDREPRVFRRFEEMMRNTGLSQIQSRLFQVPIGGWPSDPEQRAIGIDNEDNIGEMLDSHAIYPFTQGLGMSGEQVQELTEAAREEMKDLSLKLYIPFYVTWGKRR